MNKRAIIVMMVGVNLVLLGGLVLTVYELPEAKAQGVSRGGNYVLVSGQIELGIDALYVLNLDQQDLSVILINKQGKVPEIVERRPGPDIVADLRGMAGPEGAPAPRRR